MAEFMECGRVNGLAQLIKLVDSMRSVELME